MREQKEEVSHYFIHSLLSILDSPEKGAEQAVLRLCMAQAQREGAEREDRLLGLPGTST